MADDNVKEEVKQEPEPATPTPGAPEPGPTPEPGDATQPVKSKIMLTVMVLDNGKVFLNAQGTEDKILIAKLLAIGIISAADYQPPQRWIVTPTKGATPGAFGKPNA